MRLARSTYYYGGRRAAAEKVARQERIATLCPEVPRYGYRRITRKLQAECMVINQKAVGRLMREGGLRPLRKSSCGPRTAIMKIPSKPDLESLQN